jgi:hypothetical protein
MRRAIYTPFKVMQYLPGGQQLSPGEDMPVGSGTIGGADWAFELPHKANEDAAAQFFREAVAWNLPCHGSPFRFRQTGRRRAWYMGRSRDRQRNANDYDW